VFACSGESKAGILGLGGGWRHLNLIATPVRLTVDLNLEEFVRTAAECSLYCTVAELEGVDTGVSKFKSKWLVEFFYIFFYIFYARPIVCRSVATIVTVLEGWVLTRFLKYH